MNSLSTSSWVSILSVLRLNEPAWQPQSTVLLGEQDFDSALSASLRDALHFTLVYDHCIRKSASVIDLIIHFQHRVFIPVIETQIL